ncbi:DUF413 domain-containing protein, partial [Vibrio mediterranei]|uniref:DUF413 domain-containing protein n=1 Tax=Vibrio mediterranei TaxID=689 RepID=UPI004068F867
MTETQFRHGKKRFYDAVKFPRGFAKSGDFTLLEEDILVTYGETMLALERGDISPENAEEKHFTKVIVNPSKAKSKLEHTWLKYVRLARGRRGAIVKCGVWRSCSSLLMSLHFFHSID